MPIEFKVEDLETFEFFGQLRYKCPVVNQSVRCLYDTYDLEEMRSHIHSHNGTVSDMPGRQQAPRMPLFDANGRKIS